jgi:nicotinic acid phosphoribosyltransferase
MAQSLLATDGYKFSMAEAGWPLRTETFHYAHRKGGPQVLPVDVPAFLRSLLPRPTGDDYRYLAEHSYEMGPGFKAAIVQTDALEIRALPRGAVFYDREPVFTVTGPSAVVSWLEPLVLMLNYRIQVSSRAEEVRVVTCERQREIVRETLDAVGLPSPAIEIDSDGYYGRVLATAKALVEAVKDPDRIFEVGMRSASCLEQHEIALRACREAGILRTSNVLLARTLGMIPVGTMGHEHVQRYGADEPAFRAMRERRPGRSSYLLDTYDTIRSGIPAAFKLIREDPSRHDSIRYDSGDKEKQYRFAVELAKSQGIRPVMILEDGWDLALTQRFEALREEVGLEARGAVLRLWRLSRRRDRARDADAGQGRRRVEAVADRRHANYEVRGRGEARQGKHPRPPVLWRRMQGGGPAGIIGQENEVVPAGYEAWGAAPADPKYTLAFSPETLALQTKLRRAR